MKTAGNTSPRLVSLCELLLKPQEETKFLVEGLLIESGLGLLAGKPKAGKSTLARVLALAVSKGEPFLGFPTHQGNVLYYGLEEKESEVQRHFEEMGAKGNEPITISTQGFGINENEILRKDIQQCKASLVIIDPLFRVVRVKDSNAYAEMTNALAPFMVMARETGAHILCVHHLGKGGHGGADAILGSTAIRGAFDVNILLNRTEHNRTIQSEGRYGDDLPETTLTFDSVTRVTSLGETRQEAEGDRISQEILKFLKESEGLKTQREIECAVIGKTVWKRFALRKLFEGNQIERIGKGRKSDPFLYSISCSHVPTPSTEQETEHCDTLKPVLSTLNSSNVGET